MLHLLLRWVEGKKFLISTVFRFLINSAIDSKSASDSMLWVELLSDTDQLSLVCLLSSTDWVPELIFNGLNFTWVEIEDLSLA